MRPPVGSYAQFLQAYTWPLNDSLTLVYEYERTTTSQPAGPSGAQNRGQFQGTGIVIMSHLQQQSGRAEPQPERPDLYLEAAAQTRDPVFEGIPNAVAEPATGRLSPQPGRAVEGPRSDGPESIVETVAAGVAAHRRGAALIVAESLTRYPDLAQRIVMACIKRAPAAASDILAGARQSAAWGAASVLR